MPDEELGAKPKPIDFDVSIENVDEGKLDEFAKDIEGQIDSPNLDIPRSKQVPYAGRKQTVVESSDRDQGGEILSASFSSEATVPQYIRGTYEQLGGLQKWLHGRDLQKLQRDQVMKLTQDLFEYQYKDMQHILMLGMDVQKKTRFVQYLNATKSLQNRIQKESARAQLAVIDTLFTNRYDAYRSKNNRDIELQEMRKKGLLDEKQYQRSIEDNERMVDEQVDRIDETANMLITRHSEFLYKTLELFKTRLIEGGML